MLDGPYDASALSSILPRAPVPLAANACAEEPGLECRHGTFVMGLLGARPDAPIPGLCPDSPLLHLPLITDRHSGDVSTEDLARAIMHAVEAGAKLINLPRLCRRRLCQVQGLLLARGRVAGLDPATFAAAQPAESGILRRGRGVASSASGLQLE